MIFELFFDPISSADVGFYLNQVFYFVISFNFGSDLSRWWRRSSVSDVKERPTFKKVTMINDGGGHYEDCSLRLCWWQGQHLQFLRCFLWTLIFEYNKMNPNFVTQNQCAVDFWKSLNLCSYKVDQIHVKSSNYVKLIKFNKFTGRFQRTFSHSNKMFGQVGMSNWIHEQYSKVLSKQCQ